MIVSGSCVTGIKVSGYISLKELEHWIAFCHINLLVFWEVRSLHNTIVLHSHLIVSGSHQEVSREAQSHWSVKSCIMRSVSAINLLVVCVFISQVLQSSSFSTKHYIHRMRHLSMSIAPYKTPRAQNAPGNLFVDEGEEWLWIDRSNENSHLAKNDSLCPKYFMCTIMTAESTTTVILPLLWAIYQILEHEYVVNISNDLFLQNKLQRIGYLTKALT